MGSLVQQIVHDNHSVFIDRLHSQYAKFLEKLPTFTYYYHINRTHSKADTGLKNIERLTGPNAPTRYNLIKDFPLFGLEQIQLDLQDEDEMGLDSSYQGEAILLPESILPQVDDYFWLTPVGRHFLFRVTEVAYDTIAHHNYYKITFILREAESTEFLEELEKDQIVKKFQCIYDNYGTQEAWLIEEDSYQVSSMINSFIDRISASYFDYFYNKKYNCLLVKNPNGANYLYDLYVNHFCNEEKIFSYNPQNLWNMQFYVEYPPEFTYLYKGHSIQQVFKDKDLDLLRSPRFMKNYDLVPTFSDSIFQYYGDFDTMGVKIDNHDHNPFGRRLFSALPKDLLERFDTGSAETSNLMFDVLIDYLHDKISSIGELMSNYSDKFRIRPTYTDFILTPIFIYVLRKYQESLTQNQIETKVTNNQVTTAFIK